MNGTKSIFIILGGIIILVIAWFAFSSPPPQDEVPLSSQDEIGDILEGGNVTGLMPAEEQGIIVKENESVQEEGPAIQSPGSYEAYSPEKIALADSGDVILFFHAKWCPTCRAADKDILANIQDIPEGVHILKTDYDTETALKQKYKVTYQHTFVQVDASGNQITKFQGQNKLDQILALIK